MKLHARYFVVDEARLEFQKFWRNLEKKHELTFGEMFSILGDQVANLAKYLVRAERHPDDKTGEKKGDEE